MTITSYPFTEADSRKAAETWGANCGPNALAFATRRTLEDIRGVIPDFEHKRYTSPTMMHAALHNLGVKYQAYVPASKSAMFADQMALIRVQWCGPWTATGANPKWAYRQTHWIAGWSDGVRSLVFDCNGGIMLSGRWEDEIVPLLIPKRGDGEWFPTHIWRLRL